MKCPNCSHVNADNAKFCEACGTRLAANQSASQKESGVPAADKSVQAAPENAGQQIKADEPAGAGAEKEKTVSQEASEQPQVQQHGDEQKSESVQPQKESQPEMNRQEGPEQKRDSMPQQEHGPQQRPPFPGHAGQVPPQQAGRPMPPPQQAGRPMPPPQQAGRPMPPPQQTGRPMPPPQQAGSPMPPPQQAGRPMPPPQQAGRPMPPPQQDGRPMPPPQQQEAPHVSGTMPAYAVQQQAAGRAAQQGPGAGQPAPAGMPQGNVPAKGKGSKPPKAKNGKKTSPLIIVVIVVAALAVLALGIFLITKLVGGGHPKMDNEGLLKVAQDNQNLVLDIYDAPFVSAEITKEESYKDNNVTVYAYTANMVREDDSVRIEGEYTFNLVWNKSDKKWTMIYGAPEGDPKVVPKAGVSDEDIYENLDWVSVPYDDSTWYISNDNIVSKEITKRETSEDNMRETITVKVVSVEGVKQLDAEIQMEYYWSYGSWYYDYDKEKILSANVSYKEGSEFAFDEEAVYGLWSGETISLNPYAGDDINVDLVFPEDAKKIIKKVNIESVEEGYTSGEHDVKYSMDIDLDDWFQGTLKAEESFSYDEKDQTYYLNDMFSYYDFEATKIDLTGVWGGTYKNSSGDEYHFLMRLTAAKDKEDTYDAEISVSSDKDKFQAGSYKAAVTIDKGSYNIDVTAGDWINKSESFSPFGFAAYLNPSDATASWTMSYKVGFGRLSKDPKANVQENTEKTSEEKPAETTKAA